MLSIKSSRMFRVWEYRVSHSQLLLRSPKNDAEPENHDVIFFGVEHLDLPTSLMGIAITGGEAAEIAGGQNQRRKASPAAKQFALDSGGHRYRVVAAGVREQKNKLDLFESSLDSFTA